MFLDRLLLVCSYSTVKVKTWGLIGVIEGCEVGGPNENLLVNLATIGPSGADLHSGSAYQRSWPETLKPTKTSGKFSLLTPYHI